ncbi:unnamed protein product [Vitrella brassicaformis CCMP3155]|uniref:Transporter n=1 Tax=Vitrella brassicaformis (strain CCMP3155) TaxID=1169540 RepID=A0A0G4EWK5_VITBC|nr:unnamed protein product [Vitrella brassicaformis CCMP3155]|eukprot:CEM02439.1 unnamed protein product [Vitrella brassicaformis CCMP3155]
MTAAKGEEGRDRWASRFAFITAAVGSAVGLGNLWRFPYLCYSYGGGAFFIPFLLALFFLGIPMLTTEFALGQVYQGGHALAFSRVNKRMVGVGYSAPWGSIMTSSYYTAIIAYALVYLVNCFKADMPWTTKTEEIQRCMEAVTEDQCLAIGACTFSATEGCKQALVARASAFFEDSVLNMSPPDSPPTTLVWGLVVAIVVVWCCVYFSIFQGPSITGYVVYVTMTLPFLLLIALMAVGLSLPGSGMGIKAYIGEWDVKSLTETPQVWSDAVGQVFFSIGVCWGIMTAYASYNKTNQNVAQDAVIVAIADFVVAFLCGFAVFAILGYLANQAGLAFDEMPAGGMGLAFQTYPVGLAQIPGVGAQILCALFFLTLFLLGIDSAFSLVEAWATPLHDSVLFHRTRRTVFVGVVCLIFFAIALFYVTDIGLHLLDTVDWYLASVLALFNGLVQSAAVGFFAKTDDQFEKIGKPATLIFGFGYIGACVVGTIFGFALPSVLNGGLGILVGIVIAVGAVILSWMMIDNSAGLSEVEKMWWLTMGNIETLRIELNETVAPGNTWWRITPMWSILMKYCYPPIMCILLGISFSENFGRYGDYPVQYQAIGAVFAFVGIFFVLLGMFLPSAYTMFLPPKETSEAELKAVVAGDTTPATTIEGGKSNNTIKVV